MTRNFFQVLSTAFLLTSGMLKGVTADKQKTLSWSLQVCAEASTAPQPKRSGRPLAVVHVLRFGVCRWAGSCWKRRLCITVQKELTQPKHSGSPLAVVHVFKLFVWCLHVGRFLL